MQKNKKALKSCPNCLKTVIHEEYRMAELAPKDVVGYNITRVKHVIGKLYYHKDGTICDQSFYKITKHPKPKFLRLGDPTRDPRN